MVRVIGEMNANHLTETSLGNQSAVELNWIA